MDRAFVPRESLDLYGVPRYLWALSPARFFWRVPCQVVTRFLTVFLTVRSLAALITLFWLFTVNAHATPVPGTAWTLSDESSWTSSEIQTLSRLAATLPPAFTNQRVRPVLTRGPPAFPAESPELHGQVEPTHRARTLVLHSTQAANWMDEPQFARQLVHGLVHHIERRTDVATDSAWTVLSGWGEAGGRRSPVEQNPLGYAHQAGMTSPLEDLATTVERAYAPPLPTDSSLHPSCRMPAKWRFVTERFGTPTHSGDCAGLEASDLGPDDVAHIDIVFIRASTGHIASVAGHTAVLVTHKPGRSGVGREEVYTMAAITGQAEGAAYVWQGLTGGWLSEVTVESYGVMARRYSTEEGRDLERHRLVLDARQKRDVLQRLDELKQGWKRPYLFFQRNCTQLPRALAEAALQDRVRLPDTSPPDALLSELYRLGLVETLPVQRREEHALVVWADRANQLRSRLVPKLVATLDDETGATKQALQDTRRGSLSRREAGYRQLGQLSSSADGAALVALERYLAWSGNVEHHRLGPLPPDQHEAARQVSDAIRQARNQTRARATHIGMSLAQEVDPHQELFDSLARPQASGSQHTSLQGIQMGTSWDLDHPGTPWIVAGQHLYRSRLGEPRRFVLAPNLGVTLIQGNLAIRPGSDAGFRTQFIAAELTAVTGASHTTNSLVYTRLADVALTRTQTDDALDARWLEGGVGLELLQSKRHRHHLVLTMGAAARSQWEGDGSTTATVLGLGLPVRVVAAAGSGRSLTDVALEATWEPVVGSGPVWVNRTAKLRPRVHLLELGGAAIGGYGLGELRSRSKSGPPTAANVRLAAGITIERF